MRIDLSGRTALVTGSSKGIGLATARGLAEAGAAVIVNSRSGDGLEDAIAAVRQAGATDVRGIVADIGTEAGCRALIEGAPDVDILVNNATVVGRGDAVTSDDATWRQSFETNILGGARLVRHYLDGMGARGWGRIVFVSSETARNVSVDLLPYAVTKNAIHALSRGIAKQMAGTGVTCNVVVPGPTVSASVGRMLDRIAAAEGGTPDEAALRFVAEKRPSSIIRRMASAEEVAAMIIYLCSPQASASTGSAHRVDGGVIEDLN